MKRGPKPPARKDAPEIPVPDGPERHLTPDLLGDVPPVPRIVGYARVSTADQSLEMQRQALVAVGAAFIHEDEGISGATMNRPALTAALAELRRGDTLAVWRLDRLGRTTLDTLAVLRDLEERGVKFRSLTEGLDTSTPTGRMITSVIASFAEFEREVTRERVQAGINAARKAGKHLGRRPVLNPTQRQHVQQLLADGKSERHIARILRVGRSTIKRLTSTDAETWFKAMDDAGGGAPVMEDGRDQP